LRIKWIQEARRIVVKVGSYVLTLGKGIIDPSQVQSIADQVEEILSMQRKAILVSSGAIATGASRLRLNRPLSNLPEQQAAAAIGQARLMNMYEKAFQAYHREIAQLLLTHEDLADRHRFANVDHTLHVLLKAGVLPIVNENDTVATDEIKFGDNDVLATSIATLTSADLLVLMTDVDGLYETDPKKNKEAQRISIVTHPDQLLSINLQGKGYGRGGMESKICSARQAAENGVASLILGGCQKHSLVRAMNGENIGTLVVPYGKRLRGRRRWVGSGAKAKGTLILDDGACCAIKERGKSLLPSGILNVEGTFLSGDVVYCVSHEGKRIAKGLSNYSSLEIEAIRGKKCNECENILQYKGYDEVIHRDHMVFLA